MHDNETPMTPADRCVRCGRTKTSTLVTWTAELAAGRPNVCAAHLGDWPGPQRDCLELAVERLQAENETAGIRLETWRALADQLLISRPEPDTLVRMVQLGLDVDAMIVAKAAR